MGETIATAIASEFTRLAKGDRFFYLWDADLSPALRTQITWTSLSNIIGRNTSLSLQYNVFFIPEYNLAINSIKYRPGVGVELTFMGKPGCEYQINYGTSPNALNNNLLGEPVTSGDSAYMLQCIDIEATGIGERYYQVVETPLAN